jgi:hypothetical protein
MTNGEWRIANVEWGDESRFAKNAGAAEDGGE